MTNHSLAAFNDTFSLALAGFTRALQQQSHTLTIAADEPYPANFIELAVTLLAQRVIELYFERFALCIKDTKNLSNHFYLANDFDSQLFVDQITTTNQTAKWTDWSGEPIDSTPANTLLQQMEIPIGKQLQLYLLFTWRGDDPTEGTKQRIMTSIEQALDGALLFMDVRYESDLKSIYKKMRPPESMHTQLTEIGISGIRSYTEASFWRGKSDGSSAKTIELKPITLFIGPNNAGKSTLLKVLSLLKSTQQQEKPGLFAKDSAYSDLDLSKINKKFSISLKYSNQIHPVGKSKIITRVCRLDISICQESNQLFIETLSCRANEKENQQTIAFAINREYQTTYQITMLANPLGSGLPIIGDQIQLPVKANLFYIFRYIKVIFNLPDIFPDFTSSLRILHAQGKGPKRVYELNEGYLTIDGKNIEDEIHRSKNNKAKSDPMEKDLEEWIGYWLVKFNFAKHPTGPNGFAAKAFEMAADAEVSQAATFRIFNGVDWINLVDMGSGIAHLIPIIVAGYTGNHTDTIILENPEHHLHHQAQAMLAELLISIAETSGFQKRILVETQSVYLKNAFKLIALKQAKSAAGQTKTPQTTVASARQISHLLKDHYRIYYFHRETATTKQTMITFIEPIEVLLDQANSHLAAFNDFELNQSLEMHNAITLVEQSHLPLQNPLIAWYKKEDLDDEARRKNILPTLLASTPRVTEAHIELLETYLSIDKDKIECHFGTASSQKNITLYLAAATHHAIAESLMTTLQTLLEVNDLAHNYLAYLDKINDLLSQRLATTLYRVVFYTQKTIDPIAADSENP